LAFDNKIVNYNSLIRVQIIAKKREEDTMANQPVTRNPAPKPIIKELRVIVGETIEDGENFSTHVFIKAVKGTVNLVGAELKIRENGIVLQKDITDGEGEWDMDMLKKKAKVWGKTLNFKVFFTDAAIEKAFSITYPAEKAPTPTPPSNKIIKLEVGEIIKSGADYRLNTLTKILDNDQSAPDIP
jgi:hypothetical protein